MWERIHPRRAICIHPILIVWNIAFANKFAPTINLPTLPTQEQKTRPMVGFSFSHNLDQRKDGPLKPAHMAICSATLAPSFFEKRSNGDSCTV